MDELRFERLHIVRRIRETIRSWWRIELSHTDETGFVVDHGRGVIVPPPNPICESALGSPKAFERCNRSIEHAVETLAAEPNAKARFCGKCHLGIDIVAAPLTIAGRYRGAIFACGFLVQEQKETVRGTVLQRARELGLAVQTPDAAFDAIATVPERDCTKLTDLFDATTAEVIDVATELAAKQARITELSRALDEKHTLGDIVGKSAPMKALMALLEKVAASDATVLIDGENGSGKELVARALHDHGARRDRPFIAQNCSALNDNLLESELFGHVKGAFTGAVRDKIGLFEAADGGTLFLDEIGDTSSAMQLRLLRALQERTIVPVGSNERTSVDVRIVAATNRDLRALVTRGRFREDLYYRLNVVEIRVPPLRERKDDLPLLVEHFLRKHGGADKRLSSAMMASFWAYDWPGNVRELENEIERLIVLGGERELLDIELGEPGGQARREQHSRYRAEGSLDSAIAALEKEMILRELVSCRWNRSLAAERLGVSRTTLLKKIRAYRLDSSEG